MGAYEGLSRYFNGGVLQKANELGYGEFLISVLKGDVETLERKYNSVWDTLKNCKHQIAGREPLDYGKDMIATWMFEDCVVGALRKSGLNISYGKDYLTRKKFTPRPDKLDTSVIITTSEGNFNLIIRCENTGAWTRTNTIILREPQYKKLKNKKTILMALSTVDNKLILLNHGDISEAIHIDSYEPYDGKSVYSLILPNTAVRKFTIPTMVDEIRNYCLYK